MLREYLIAKWLMYLDEIAHGGLLCELIAEYTGHNKETVMTTAASVILLGK